MKTIIFLAICLILMVISIIMMVKNDVTYKQRCKITKAICVYGIKCITAGEEPLVDYDDMEDYDKTLYRLWDWGYTRILPKEKFEIIKPFIKE